MARTNAQARAYISEIAEIIEQIRVMNVRKHELGEKLGFGSWRTRKLPHLVCVVARGGGGFSTSWKKLAAEFGERLDLSESQIESRSHRYRKHTYRNPTVALYKDKADWNNPKLEFVD